MAKISDENLIFEIFIKRKKTFHYNQSPSFFSNHFQLFFARVFQAYVNFPKSSRII